MDKLIKTMSLLSPIHFGKYLFKEKFQTPAHIIRLDNKLTNVIDNGNKNLIVNMPPRHGKSFLLSKIFPVWYLLSYPQNKIILVTYSSFLSEFLSKDILNLLQLCSNDFNIKLESNSKSKAEFTLLTGGGLSSVGVGGSLTGKGANLILVDDPIKNDAEANSQYQRDTLYEWFKATLFTRLEPSGKIIIIMTRWHSDDLTGKLINDNPSNWQLFSLPAISISNGKEKPLWEERFELNALKDIKKSIGTYWFNALYMQEPELNSGNIFNTTELNYYEFKEQLIRTNEITIMISNLLLFQVVDLAITSNINSDFTVILSFGVDKESNIYILNVVREKVKSIKISDFILNQYMIFKPQQIGIESVQFQSIISDTLLSHGVPVKKLYPNKDKVSRALPMAALLDAGKIFLPKNSSWNNDFMHELKSFPFGKHDDQVDCFSYIYEFINKGRTFNPKSVSKKNKSKFIGKY